METMVREFYEKFGFPINRSFITDSVNGTNFTNHELEECSEVLKFFADYILPHALEVQQTGDHRLFRTHLMLEELSEIIKAFHNGSEIDFADGLADLLYVVIGTAVTYNIPIIKIFKEVHTSNMTKERNDYRLINKGPYWNPPKIREILDERV